MTSYFLHTWSVADSNDNFPLAQTNVNSCCNCITRSFGIRDDLEQLHFIHWRKVMHSNHLKVQRV